MTKSLFSFLIPGHPNGVNFSRHTPFFIRFKQDEAEKVLALSRPGSIIVDTPVELANSFKHVWLRIDGENYDEDKVIATLDACRNFGAFEKRVLGQSVLLIMNTPLLKRPLV